MFIYLDVCLREAIPPKKLLTFEHYQKGGGGVRPESKSFGVDILGHFLTLQEVASHAQISPKWMVLLFLGAGAEVKS